MICTDVQELDKLKINNLNFELKSKCSEMKPHYGEIMQNMELHPTKNDAPILLGEYAFQPPKAPDLRIKKRLRLWGGAK